MFSCCVFVRKIDRFRNARYDFVEAAVSPASKKRNTVKVSRKDRGTHEPIEDMPCTLGFLVKVHRVKFFVCMVPFAGWAWLSWTDVFGSTTFRIG